MHLDAWEASLLENQAEKLGVDPSVLAQAYVRAGLAGGNGNGVAALLTPAVLPRDAGAPRQRGLDALDRLAAATADLPRVDAVGIARASRRALERRALG